MFIIISSILLLWCKKKLFQNNCHFNFFNITLIIFFLLIYNINFSKLFHLLFSCLCKIKLIFWDQGNMNILKVIYGHL